jgi:hypothetical protein
LKAFFMRGQETDIAGADPREQGAYEVGFGKEELNYRKTLAEQDEEEMEYCDRQAKNTPGYCAIGERLQNDV